MKRTEEERFRKNITSNHITPATVEKLIHSSMASIYNADYVDLAKVAEEVEEYVPIEKVTSMVDKLKKEMFKAAKNLEFEKAAELRDRIQRIQSKALAAS